MSKEAAKGCFNYHICQLIPPVKEPQPSTSRGPRPNTSRGPQPSTSQSPTEPYFNVDIEEDVGRSSDIASESQLEICEYQLFFSY